jgi:hypothetical protein
MEIDFEGFEFIWRLSSGIDGGFSHRRRPDYFMNYYIRGGHVEAGGAPPDWVLATATSRSEQARPSTSIR